MTKTGKDVKVFVSSSPDDTLALGKKIGQKLQPKDVLALQGELGAGKTTFVQGLALGLDVKDFVNSPSFIIANEYPGRHKLFHIDLYRLDSVKDIEDLGISEYLGSDGVAAIEWAEKLEDLILPEYFWIKFEVLDEGKRKICIPLALAARLL